MTTKLGTDPLGIDIHINDRVTVCAWGEGNTRLADVRRVGTVTGKGRTLITVDLNEWDKRVLRTTAGCILVARRDGKPGHEGNAR